MKSYLIILLIFVITFTNIADARRVKRYNRRRGALATNLYQFAKGFVEEILGGVSFDSCLPDTWKSANGSEEGQFENNVSSYTTTWQKILGYLGKAIDVFCIVKDVVEKLQNWLINQEKKFIRRWVRLYLQGRRVSLRRRGWFSDAWTFVKDKVQDGAQAVAKGVSTVYKTVKKEVTDATDWVGQEIGKISDAVKKAITDTIENIYDTFKTVKEKLAAFVKSDLFQKIKRFVDCLYNLYKAVNNAIQLYKGITEKAAAIAAFPVGLVPIIIGLICAWKDFAQIIKYIIEGVNNTGTKRWNYFGKALGKLGYTLGTF